MKIPQHVAIILDGNGRWAKARMMPRTFGHKQGAKNVDIICRAAQKMGIKYVTVYAFSTENWKRSESEVNTLMDLLRSYMKTCLKDAEKNQMRVRVLGDKSGFAPDIQKTIAEMEEATKGYTEFNFQLAINYGSRDEITRSVRRMMQDCKDGKLDPSDVTEETISSYLDTADIPDPDLMIRTSGEQRLSNYLLWQLAYAEFYFTDVAWPDFTPEELEKAIDAYNQRDRRFGKIKEEAK